MEENTQDTFVVLPIILLYKEDYAQYALKTAHPSSDRAGYSLWDQNYSLDVGVDGHLPMPWRKHP